MLALPTTEAFTFLHYWRGGAGLPPPPITAVPHNDSETDTNTDSDDDGSCFDLHFTLPDQSHHPQNDDVDHHDDDDNNNQDSECECEGGFKFALSPSNPTDLNPSLSPSQLLLHLDLNSSQPNSKPRFHASSLLKSATKFRVFMSGLKKPKANVVTSSSHNNKDKDSHDSVAVPNPKKQRKLFTVKFKVDEVPIMSFFTRDNSSKGGGDGGASVNDASQNKKHNPEQESQSQSPASASDEKRLHKYLKMVKPLYVKVSRRYAEKLRFSGQLNMTSSASPPSATAAQKPAPSEAVEEKVKVQPEGDSSEAALGGANVKGQKQRNLALTAGLRVVCKHLGKSRSAAETVAVSAPVPAELVSSRRRDDSLLQQHDGIQGAILHCKSSFNAPTESESSQLPQCVTDPLHENEISPELSTNEGKSKQRVLFSNVSLMHSVKTKMENVTT